MRTTADTKPRRASVRKRDGLAHVIRARTSGMVIGAAALLLIPSASAVATPAGQNGDIAFRRYLGPDRTNGAIFTVGPDGSRERQLTAPRAPLSDDFPDFAPDGSFIAFHRGREGGTNRILTVRPDGTGLRRVDRGCRGSQLPPRCAEAACPAIAPNGRRIRVRPVLRSHPRRADRRRGDLLHADGRLGAPPGHAAAFAHRG